MDYFDRIEDTKHINKIEKDAFTGCKSLKKVYVPKNGTTIEEGAFSDDTEVVLY